MAKITSSLEKNLTKFKNITQIGLANNNYIIERGGLIMEY